MFPPMDTNGFQSAPVLWFDAECLICNRSIQFILKYEKDSRLKFGALQSDPGQTLHQTLFKNGPLESMIYLSSDGELSHSSDALIAVSSHLKAPWSYLRWLRWIPRKVRNLLYRQIARNRHRWNRKSASCTIPTPEMRVRMVS
ncbi:MAG: DCC1-like thiol-disulfide oxidoreductase family protein [Verrucomicrobiota bacterium]